MACVLLQKKHKRDLKISRPSVSPLSTVKMPFLTALVSHRKGGVKALRDWFDEQRQLIREKCKIVFG